MLNALLNFQIINFEGTPTYSRQVETNSPAFTSALLYETVLEALPLNQRSIFSVTLESNGKLIYEETKTASAPKSLKFPKPKITVSIEKKNPSEYIVKLVSDVYARAVYLRLGGLAVEFSDNYFDLLPGKTKTIECKIQSNLITSDQKKALNVETYPYNGN